MALSGRSTAQRTPAEAPESDEGVRLMLAFQQGDERAFDRLVELYSASVYALLTRFLGPRAEREDLVQEVFLRILRARERYQPSARFSTLLYRVVFNLCCHERERSALRSGEPGGLRLVREVEGEESDIDVEDPRAEAPHAALDREDVVRAVRAALEALPPKQRMALILARYEELSLLEIGEVLGISEAAAKALVHRAREALRARLAPWLEAEREA